MGKQSLVHELTGAGASGRSLVGFLICLVDSRRAGTLAGLGPESGNSDGPANGVVGVVVSAFRLTPFFTWDTKYSQLKKYNLNTENNTFHIMFLRVRSLSRLPRLSCKKNLEF